MFCILLLFFYFATNKTSSDVFIRQQESAVPDLFEQILFENFASSRSSLLEDYSPSVISLDRTAIPEPYIEFFLFTNENPSESVRLRIGDAITLKNSGFSGEFPIKLLIHGWSDTGVTLWVNDFRKNYLKTGNYNVIIVNWAMGSLREYLTSAKITRQVGDCVAQFLEFLLSEGVATMDNVHILGHSLGAHVAGFAGKRFSGKIARITGMDPARPDFEAPLSREPKDRLDFTDAQFVDVIHTCAGTVGYLRPIGHVDFYPNGGSFRQPGCPVVLTQYCSHGRSHQFMMESIWNPKGFPAIECDGWKGLISNDRCEKSSGRVVYMGENLEIDARGVYFLETNAESPYGRGEP